MYASALSDTSIPMLLTTRSGTYEYDTNPSKARLQELREAVLRFAGVTCRTRVFEARLPQPHPRAKAAYEAITLGHRLQQIDNPPIDQRKVAGVERDVQVRDTTKQPVERLVRGALDEILLAPLPNRIDDVPALAPARDEIREDLGRILEIRVHDDDAGTGGEVQAAGDRDLMAEVARQRDAFQARIEFVKTTKHLAGTVYAPVVDEDDFPRLADGIQSAREALDQLIERFLFVEYRYDDGNRDPSGRRRLVLAGRAHGFLPLTLTCIPAVGSAFFTAQRA